MNVTLITAKIQPKTTIRHKHTKNSKDVHGRAKNYIYTTEGKTERQENNKKCLNINNSSIHFAILVKKMENMVKLIFGLPLISFVLITCRSADSYYINKIPTCTIIILCLSTRRKPH